jgi:alpha-N-arabinofuranosidase
MIILLPYDSTEFAFVSDHAEAGMTLLQNNTHHYDLLLRRSGDRWLVCLRVHIGSLTYTVSERVVTDHHVLFKIVGDALRYTFYYADPKDEVYVSLGSLDTRYLSTEVAGGFTGVMIGLYTTSNGTPTAFNAYYDWFEYRTAEVE